MFASQLLRILQSIPTNVNYETCPFDTSKPKLTMTENQIGINNSNSNKGEVDPLSFSASEPLQRNGHAGNPNTLEFGMKDGHDFWNTARPRSSVLDNSVNGNESEGSLLVGNQNLNSNLKGFGEDAGSPVSDTNCKSETQITPELLGSITDSKSANCDEKDSETSATVAQAFASDWNPFLDKNVIECELPEFMVCYRENNIQIVKDICVDEGVPADNKSLNEDDKDDHPGLFVSQLSDEEKHSEIAQGGTEIEFFVPEGFKAASPQDISHNPSLEAGTEKIDETKAADNGTKEESSICSAPVSDELILQDPILESSKCDENKVEQQQDEIPSIEAILESLAVAFTSEEPKKDGPISSMGYNSKVEGGTITFDFNSSKPTVTSNTDGSVEIPPGNAPKAEDEKLNDNLAPIPFHLANSEEKAKENASSDPNPLSQDSPNNANKNSDNLSASNRLERGEGESSFSTSGPVSGLITNSDPVAYSGSISLRSDSSTTSARSFAFPILQTEWNSSPVRMEKADQRHLRKQRGWRQGLFCCRF